MHPQPSQETPAPVSAQRRRIVLAAAGAVAVGIGASGALNIGAAFTAQTSLEGQRVTTAVVEIAADAAPAAIPLDAQALLPGDSAQTEVTISNTGGADVYYTITAQVADDHEPLLSQALQLEIEVADVTVSHPLLDWETGVLHIGEILASGSSDQAQLRVSLAADASNDVQGAATEFSLLIHAIQAKHTPQPVAGWIAE